MIFDNLDLIESKKNDYKALRALWKQSTRKPVELREFCAPLMISAHKLKHLNKINELYCDAIVINLEDGVAPEHKEMALHLAMLFITHLDNCDKKIIVRVNPLESGGHEEILKLNSVSFDAIRLPKAKNINDVNNALEQIENGAELHLSIETREAWNNLASLAVNSNVTTLYFGILDLFADLNLPHDLITVDNPTVQYMLSHFLVTSKSIGCYPVSFVFQDYKDLNKLESWLELEKKIGYNSKGIISPEQAKLVMNFFSNKSSKKERALYIIKRFEEESKRGVTGFPDEKYGFIDEPIYKGALKEIGRT